jgi:hypothetical protein
MNYSQHYNDKSFCTPVVIKRIGTRGNNPLVQVVKGKCEHTEYVLGHSSITPIKNATE